MGREGASKSLDDPWSYLLAGNRNENLETCHSISRSRASFGASFALLAVSAGSYGSARPYAAFAALAGSYGSARRSSNWDSGRTMESHTNRPKILEMD